MTGPLICALAAMMASGTLLAQAKRATDERPNLALVLEQRRLILKAQADRQRLLREHGAQRARAHRVAEDAEAILGVLQRRPPAPPRTYAVRKGDSLVSIAKRIGGGVSVEDLSDANPGVDPKTLRIGQRIVLPRGSDADLVGATTNGFVEALDQAARHMTYARQANDLDAAQEQLDEAERAFMAARRELWRAKRRLDEAKQKRAKKAARRNEG